MRIAVDLDEVLAEFVRGLTKFHNKTYQTSLKYEEFGSYNFWTVWGGTRAEAIDKVYAFQNSEYFDDIQLVDGAVEGIDFLKQNNDLYIITSRQNRVVEKTHQWIDKYFPNTFLEIHFTNDFHKSEEPRNKSEVCSELDIDIIIEDNFKYAVNCVINGINVILIKRPWNQKYHQQAENIEGISLVDSWPEITLHELVRII